MINDYHFISRWRVDGTCGEVADILGDPLALTQWWPSVRRDAGHGRGRSSDRPDPQSSGWKKFLATNRPTRRPSLVPSSCEYRKWKPAQTRALLTSSTTSLNLR